MEPKLTASDRSAIKVLIRRELTVLKEAFALNREILDLIAAVETARIGSNAFLKASRALGERLHWELSSPDPIDRDQVAAACDQESFFLKIALV